MLKKYWRRFNTILFIIAFFAPWLHSCGVATFNGFEFTILFGLATSHSFSGSGTSTDGQSGLLAPIIFLGLICILLYTVINLICSLGVTTRILSCWRLGVLIGGGIGMLASLALTGSSDMSIEDYLWGYWLTWVALVSSSGVEIMDAQAGTANVPDG